MYCKCNAFTEAFVEAEKKAMCPKPREKIATRFSYKPNLIIEKNPVSGKSTSRVFLTFFYNIDASLKLINFFISSVIHLSLW